jgi:hypothetical protein
MGNHRSKTAKIRGFHFTLNTLLGLNDLKYYLLIARMCLCMNFAFNEHALTHCQLRQSKLFSPYQQHYWCSDTYIEIFCRE